MSRPFLPSLARGGIAAAVAFVSLTMILGSGVSGSSHAPPAPPRPLGGLPGWTLLAPNATPPGLATGGAMAYDPADGYLVLFGGCASGDFWFSTCTPTNATWIFQNNTWTQLNITISPPARFYSSLVWDPEDGSLVLFGGNGTSTVGFLNDTWTFVHGNWTQLHPTVSPPARAAAGMVYDAHDGYVLLVDGEQFRTLTVPATNTYVGADFNDSWTLSSGTWTQLTPTDNPSARDSVGITYDVAMGSVVLFGGFNWTTYNLDDTWVFQAGSWTLVAPSGTNGTYYGTPGDRNNPSLAYDPAAQGDVLFGGHTGYAYYNDTWVFANGNWSPSNFSGPSPRWGMSLAYDPSYGCLISYGGYLPYTYDSDTWSFGCGNATGGNGSSGNGSSGNGSSGGGSSGNGSGGNGSGNGSLGSGLAHHRGFGDGPASPGGFWGIPPVTQIVLPMGVAVSIGGGVCTVDLLRRLGAR
jgi:hypothetical protein